MLYQDLSISLVLSNQIKDVKDVVPSTTMLGAQITSYCWGNVFIQTQAQ